MTVTVYSQPSCVQCNQTYRALDRKGIPYDVVDVSQDKDAHQLVTGLGYRSAPVVIAGDEHWGGFQPARIDAIAKAVAAA